MKQRLQRGFTIIELLVVVSIIALLIGILLPAIGKARDQARLTISQTNLRNLATAHANYEAEWQDRQFTLVVDSFGSYGANATGALDAYNASIGATGQTDSHPPIILGWRTDPNTNTTGLWGYWMDFAGNATLLQPISFFGTTDQQGFGWFRIPNAKQFNQYVSGRYYDPIFFAPKDTSVIPLVEECFQDPGEFCTNGGSSDTYWSSYCLSPAALYNPEVMRNADRGGWQSPFDLAAGFRAPSSSQALHPSLKTRMLEHHWLQQRRSDCNPNIAGGTFDGCEPYYFNASWESAPVALWYDGHVETIGVREAEQASARQEQQVGYGLWSEDTPFGVDGYFSELGYDFAQTSFHVLTTDGIRGRDTVGSS